MKDVTKKLTGLALTVMLCIAPVQANWKAQLSAALFGAGVVGLGLLPYHRKKIDESHLQDIKELSEKKAKELAKKLTGASTSYNDCDHFYTPGAQNLEADLLTTKLIKIEKSRSAKAESGISLHRIATLSALILGIIGIYITK